MRKSIKVILLLFTSAIVVSACGNDPNAANATNFENALNNYYAQMKQCVSIGGEPNDEGIVQEFRTDSVVPDNQLPFYNGLVSLGLMETVSYQKNTRSFSGQVTGKADWIGFKFTEWGQTFLRPTELDKGALSTRSPQLCYATPQIIEIMSFTKPSDVMGTAASNVEYTYKLVNVAPWANDPFLENHFEWLPEILSNQSIPKNDDLVLTKDGWVHYKVITLLGNLPFVSNGKADYRNFIFLAKSSLLWVLVCRSPSQRTESFLLNTQQLSSICYGSEFIRRINWKSVGGSVIMAAVVGVILVKWK